MTYVTEDLTENLGAEVRFITGDRVDLLMKDEAGRYVVIEVEPQIGPADNIGFHQAGKYRILVAMEKRLRPGQVRAIVAAASIDGPLADDYARLYGIEPRVIALPPTQP
jgi:RecB family endonuclease NucS